MNEAHPLDETEASGTLTRRTRDMLARLLEQGELGSPLPPERQLATLFNVSRVTIRRVLALLAEDEMLSRQQGRGTYARSGSPIYKSAQIAQMQGNVIVALTHLDQTYFDPQKAPFFWRVFQSLERLLAPRKTRVVFASMKEFLASINRGRRKRSSGLKGFIALGNLWQGIEYEQAYDSGLPFVAIERAQPAYWNVLDIDWNRPLAEALEDMRVGPSDQVLLTGERFPMDWGLRPTLLEHLDRRGVPATQIHYGQRGVFEGDGYLAMRRHLREVGAPSVVITDGDLVAAGVYRALAEAFPRKMKSLSIGPDIRILGFGDYEISRFLEPPLSTIAMNTDALVATVWEMLEQQVRTGAPVGMRRIENATYIARASTRSKMPVMSAAKAGLS